MDIIENDQYKKLTDSLLACKTDRDRNLILNNNFNKINLAYHNYLLFRITEDNSPEGLKILLGRIINFILFYWVGSSNKEQMFNKYNSYLVSNESLLLLNKISLSNLYTPAQRIHFLGFKHFIKDELFKQIDGLAKIAKEPEKRLVLLKKVLLLTHRGNEDYIWAKILNEIGILLSTIHTLDYNQNLEDAIIYFNQALEVFTFEKFPDEWAYAQSNLGNAYRDRMTGNREENLRLAINYHKLALTVRIRERFPILWAETCNNLGNVYCSLFDGNKEENIEIGLKFYHLALEVRTRKNEPLKWAMTQKNIAKAYRSCNTGNRIENIKNAIDIYKEVLKIRTKEKYPNLWADTIIALGNAYSEQDTVGTTENIRKSINAHNSALEVYTYELHPTKWALIQRNIGNAYCKQDTVANLKKGIEAYNLSLKIYSYKQFPYDWSCIMHHLGNAYMKLFSEGRSNNIEEAINYFNQALKVRRRNTFPNDWANTLSSLGVLYLGRICGDRSQNVKKSLKLFNLCLRIYSIDSTPNIWALIQNNIGIAYSHQSLYQNLEKSREAYWNAQRVNTQVKDIGLWLIIQNHIATTWLNETKNRSASIKKAIDILQHISKIVNKVDMPLIWANIQNNLCNALNSQQINRAEYHDQVIKLREQILQIYTREEYPEDWASTMDSLGIDYLDQLSGDRAENIEKSIIAYKCALEVRTRDELPSQWATTQHNLSLAFHNRLRGSRVENLEESIKINLSILEVCTRKADPVNWAMTQNTLGNGYLQLGLEGNVENIEEAIRCYKLALEVRDRKDNPHEWGNIQNNLGNAYRELKKGNLDSNLLEAIRYYELALEVRTIEEDEYDWAATNNNIGGTYWGLDNGNKFKNLDKSVEFYKRALTIFTPLSFPDQCRKTAIACGNIHFGFGEFESARQVYEVAHEAIENLRKQIFRVERKSEIGNETASFYKHLISSCLQLGDIAAAFNYCQSAKGRTNSEHLTLVNPLDTLVNAHPEISIYYNSISELQKLLDELTFQLHSELSSESKIVINKIKYSDDNNIERKKNAANIVGRITAIRGEINELLEELSYRFPVSTSIQYLSTINIQSAMSLAAGIDATIIEFFQIDRGWIAFIITSSFYRVVDLPDMNFQTVESFTANLNNIRQFRPMLDLAEDNQLDSTGDWPVIFQLYKILWQPLETYLPKDGRIVISPYKNLHLIPFGVLKKDIDQPVLYDLYTLSVTSSSSFLQILFQQKMKSEEKEITNSNKNLLSVVYPGHNIKSKSYLTNVEDEAIAIAKYFTEVSNLFHENASPDKLIEICREKEFTAIHFGCHGSFDSVAAEHTGLYINGTLSVQKILTRLRFINSPLVTLAACQTGLSSQGDGGDLVGLNQAMFVAGASNIVSSLWSVNDSSTRSLFEEFYKIYCNDGISVAESLQYAIRMVRENPSWQSPFYWGAFQVIGLPI